MSIPNVILQLRKNKYDGMMEYWCDTEMTGERVQTESMSQRETIQKECSDSSEAVQELNMNLDFTTMIEQKEIVKEEDAKNVISKSKQSLPKLEEEQQV